MFRLLSQLAISLLTVPFSNVVERDFCHVTLTKTDLQKRMFLETFKKILHVKFRVTRNGKCCRNFTPAEIILKRFDTTAVYSGAAV
ncbi:hypothetical protein HPB48_004161 [Haemaphysalis longicornis]|uniref:Secreted protein n=1 Tax=Haemaphysalis longicornis TaxID=44386 RepID=A0A9J6G929_HAELO|nr:hypothetical protein HPB48_004161 [Haemaphysalis longicornis]